MSRAIQAAWDETDPAGTQSRLESFLESTSDPCAKLEIQTQIARCHTLRGDHEACKALLATVKSGIAELDDREDLEVGLRVVRARLLLETGRNISSSGDPESSIRHLRMSLQTSRLGPAARLLPYEFEAVHLLSLNESEPGERVRRGAEGIAVAEKCGDADMATRWTPVFARDLALAKEAEGDWEGAVDAYKREVKELEKGGGGKKDTKASIKTAKSGLAAALRKAGKMEEAAALEKELDDRTADR
ncbi:hypothetical protein HK101_004561 [Irineochytrium annulatum]|nr:hypothetical protein HK101_004561 [Irineochytrium annulatum]